MPLVYIDIVSGVEVASDSFDQKLVDGYQGVRQIQSQKIIFKEAEVNVGGNASAGGGEGGDEDVDEGVEENEAVSVIDVVHAAKLQKMDLSAKEFASMQKAYWKRLIEALNQDRYKTIGIRITEDDDKDSIKEKEAAAMEELSAFEKKAVEACKEKMAAFKAAFESLGKFVKEVVIANFDEFEFYLCEEGELGECMIIPARYIGEAEAPIFYMYDAGLRFKKE